MSRASSFSMDGDGPVPRSLTRASAPATPRSNNTVLAAAKAPNSYGPAAAASVPVPTPRQHHTNALAAYHAQMQQQHQQQVPAGSSPSAADVPRLQGEVEFLRSKIRYLQSVSTIFRQKVAMIMRDLSKNPQGFPRFHDMYADALAAVTNAEQTVATPPRQAFDGPASDGRKATSALSALAIAGMPNPEERQHRRSAVDKAHQLCLILQEKNEIQQRELELRTRHEALTQQFEELRERHARLIELQSSGGGGVAQAQVEAFRARETQLEKAVLAAKQEAAMAAVRAERTSRTASLADGTHVHRHQLADDGCVGTDAETLAKQNELLKGRVERLKHELSAQSRRAEESARRSQENLEELVSQVQSAKREVETQVLQVRHLQSERRGLLSELDRLRAEGQMQRAEMEALQVFASNHRGHAPGSREGSASSAGPHVRDGGATTEAILDSLQHRLDASESQREALQEQVWAMEAAATDKDVQIDSLGRQIRSFRARVDAFEAETSQRSAERTMVQQLEQRVVAAVDEIRRSNSTEELTSKVQDMNTKLQTLETVEQQLRHKEDVLAIAEDELARQRAAHDELLATLNSVSTLFATIPRSVGEVERLVIEHGEFKAELERCVVSQETPDLVSVGGRIELRCIEAESGRNQNRQGAIRGPSEHHSSSATTMPSTSHHHQGAAPSGLNSDVPPIPPLVDLSAGLNNPSSAEPHSRPSSGSAPVTEDDVRITFQLFDEEGTGVLPTEALHLCLSTLGLSPSLLPQGTEKMSAPEFLALCLRSRGDNRQQGRASGINDSSV